MRRGAISAWISTDHEIISESPTKQELRRATCWIPSKANKPFRIGYTASTKRGHGLKVTIYIDGELAAEQTHAPPQRRLRWTHRDGVRGMKEGFGTERPFLFSKRSITDNDLDTISETTLSSLGSIQVHFTWIRVDHSSLSERPCTRLDASQKHHESIYEGQVKQHSSAIAHAAGLGARRKLQPKWWSSKKIKFGRKSVKDVLRPARWSELGLHKTQFEFKYAPADYLEAEGILRLNYSLTSYPPTPSPNMASTHSPWRSHVGTPYRELRADMSFGSSLSTPHPIRARPGAFSFRDSGLNFDTPDRPMKLGSHIMTNYTPLATLGHHTIVHPTKLRPLVNIKTEKASSFIKQEDDEIAEISASEFYRREIVDLTGLDSDDE